MINNNDVKQVSWYEVKYSELASMMHCVKLICSLAKIKKNVAVNALKAVYEEISCEEKNNNNKEKTTESYK